VEYAGENNYDQISVDNTRPGTTNNQNGLFNFSDGQGITTKAAVANAALGIFNTYGEIGTRSYTLFRGNMYSMFGQDQWRVNSKLVLEYGIRYDIMQSYHALWGNQAFFNPSVYNPSLAPTVNPSTGFLTGGDAYNGVVIPGSGFPDSAKGHVPDAILNGTYSRLFRGFDSNYSPTVYSNIQPRIGFAYEISPAPSFAPAQALHPAPRHQRRRTRWRQRSLPACLLADERQRRRTRRQWCQPASTRLYLACLQVPQPESWGWNVTVEHEFTNVAVFTLSYVGRRAYHLEQLANINQLQPGTIQANPSIAKPDALRPYKGFATIIESQNTGGAFYHSMQAT